MEFKIYTKTGDKGETSLIGGRRVPKYHDQIEAYGTVDELNSFVGLLRDQPVSARHHHALGEIQDRLFTIESLLAVDTETTAKRPIPDIRDEDIVFLELEIDAMNEHLPDLSSFILPGGHPFASMAHIARTVCRRAERVVLKLSLHYPVEPLAIRYLNRLSDYFFVLARDLTYAHGGQEILWHPRV